MYTDAWRHKLLELMPGKHFEMSYEAVTTTRETCQPMFNFLHRRLGHLTCVEKRALEGDGMVWQVRYKCFLVSNQL